jgi:hypothetical protein
MRAARHHARVGCLPSKLLIAAAGAAARAATMDTA